MRQPVPDAGQSAARDRTASSHRLHRCSLRTGVATNCGRTWRSLAGAFLSLAASGCYGFYAVEPADMTPNQEVRLVLSPEAPRRVTTAAMYGDDALEGNFVGLTDDSVAIAVWIGQAFRGTSFESVRETITFPRVHIERFERRALSKWRTALSAIGIIAGVAILAERTVFQDNPNPDDNGGPPDPPEFIVIRR